MSVDLFLIDSIVELTQRDTVTRVRYVRASTRVRDTTAKATNKTVADTTAVARTQIAQTPIAVEEKKKGGSVASRHVRMALCIFFLIFFAVSLVCVKKSLFLRR